jgi:hypothetical protein
MCKHLHILSILQRRSSTHLGINTDEAACDAKIKACSLYIAAISRRNLSGNQGQGRERESVFEELTILGGHTPPNQISVALWRTPCLSFTSWHVSSLRLSRSASQALMAANKLQRRNFSLPFLGFRRTFVLLACRCLCYLCIPHG